MDKEDYRDNYSMTEAQMEEAARRRRARRKRDHKLKVIFTTIVILCLLAICAVVYAFFLVPRDADLPWPKFLGARPQLKTGTTDVSKDEGNPLLNAIENQLGAQSETQSAPEPAAAPVIAETEKQTEPQTQPVTEPSASAEAQKMISDAQLLAAGYDYDGAIGMLMSISGYDTDASIQQMITDYTTQRDACVAVEPTTVPHIFYHSLLNSTAKAFDVEALGQGAVDGYNAWMVTVDEFDKITQRLYDAGYVYVRLRDLVIQTTDADGVVHFTPNTELKLPEGKKAIVLSVDDCSYYHSYAPASFPEKLVLDENGDVKCLYTDPAGNTSVGDYDVVPRLNSFLKEHPDGAYHGARGILAMTGYNGVFGYRTDTDYLLQENLMEDQRAWLDSHPDYNYDQDVADATAIADALKEEGWEFASHTWGHLSVTDKSVDTLRTDNEKWVATVEPITGPVDTIIFAHGNDIGNWEGYSDNEKYDYYNSVGYHFYCNVDGSQKYWVQFGSDYMRQGRRNLDGYRMYYNPEMLEDLFDVSQAWDEARPTPVPEM